MPQEEQLSAVLNCLNTKLTDIDYAPPSFENGYRLRYRLGPLPEEPEAANKLHLLVYGPGERHATLYMLYIGQSEHRLEIEIGMMGKYALGKRRTLEPVEIPGGVATFNAWNRVVSILSKEPAINVSSAPSNLGVSCVYRN